MFQKIWNGLTTATFLVATLGIGAPGYANSVESVDDGLPAKVSQPEVQTEPESSGSPQAVASANSPASPAASTIALDSATAQTASKVGEYQSQTAETDAVAAIATLRSHAVNGRQATTLYVRGIPILTFLGAPLQPSSTVSAAPSAPGTASHPTTDPALQATAYPSPVSDVKLPTPSEEQVSVAPEKLDTPDAKLASAPVDEVWRAAAIAARINQLSQEGVDASTITVRWDSQRQHYLIQAGDTELVALGTDVILPDTTRNPAQDALQATNRLRRLLGNAAPLSQIVGDPRSTLLRVSFGSLQLRVSGIASWYGPGFHGNRSASGEVFNQNELTAAHRTLPFGTQVRVTNVQTGQSVIVRINDRGPFSGRRIIDLSAAAARAIGMMGTGVAPVNLEVLPTRTAYQQ